MFNQLLDRALREPELVASMGATGETSAGALRRVAREHRAYIMDQARGAEEEYLQAAGGVQAAWRSERGWSILSWATGVAALVVTLAACVAGGWSAEIDQAMAERRPVSFVDVLVQSAGILMALALLGAIAGAVTWWAYWFLVPAVRTGDSAAEDRRLNGTVVGATGFVAVLAAASLSASVTKILWVHEHHRPPGPDDTYGWEWALLVGTLIIYAGAYWLLRGRLAEFTSEYVGDGGEPSRLETVWREALHECVLGFLRSHIGEQLERRYATVLSVMSAPGLRRVRALDYHVVTPAEETLIRVCNGMDGGSIALAGPRGAGKSELLNAYCKGVAPDSTAKLAVEVTAPVVYDRREFMLHLLARLCRVVIREKLRAAPEATRILQRVRYQHTRSGELNASGGWGPWSMSAKRGTTHTRQPLAYPEIVQMLTGFLGVVAEEVSTAIPARRLVVSIDELDRIAPAAVARDFLNELKVVFDVPHCLFVLSVSDEALKEADLSPAGRRDAFDSAIDEVVRVEPLDHRTAVKLLDTRVIGLPAPFAALFYCLSGGMPRGLLRTARAAVALLEPDRPSSLAEVTAGLVERELARTANSAGDGVATPGELLQFFRMDVVAGQGGLRQLGDRIAEHAAVLPGGARLGVTLANRAYFLDTVSSVFSGNVTEQLITEASRPGHSGSFSALARAQREIGTADVLARSTLDEIRKAWTLTALPPIAPAGAGSEFGGHPAQTG